MINYILQVILFQVLFLAVYDLFLSRETFFTKNRLYLISTPIFSFLIPFIKIPTFQKAVSQEYIVYLPEIFLSPEKVIKQAIETNNFNPSVNYIGILFGVGFFIFLAIFIVKLSKVINLIIKNNILKKDSYQLVFLPKETKAFSFFNYIFLGKDIPESQQEKIIQHELVHSKQKHSLDLLFFEFLKIVMWFNPMIILYQKRITLLHEYISDKVVAKLETKETYINNLLSNFFQVENISFINQFYKQSLIKKRIIMMTKKQSKKMNQLKYLVLIPVLASMLFYTSCSESSSEEVIAKKELTTMYMQFGKEELKESKGDKEAYLDFYMGTELPKWKEISYNELSNNEKNEFDNHISNYKEKESSFYNSLDIRIYKGDNGRNIIANIIDFSKMKRLEEQKIDDKIKENNEELTVVEEVSFMKIGKAPTFPGCEPGDKKCFSKNIQKHFTKNFDSELPNTLGLESGRKRVFISFKIDKQGNVIDIKARAPHEDIKNEVISVMSSLPKMIPGENEGKKVSVKYAIPFTLVVE
ncbi:M56 family metallopeptidase [uncultured Polaribacter sp.]|uniref:M56 family metallopeptidase n=1 Tax=uncultured Polaribacter sp. TaxID=174711 RepID=UPI00262B38F6|nr:M56 family metallopeptidase [uncultured Polaribacter sp.]